MQLLGIRVSKTTRKFFKLLRSQLFLILLLTIPFLVIISSFAFIGTGVRESLKQNAIEALILGSALVRESGPDFKERSEEYAMMIKQFVDHMENRRFSPVVRILFPGFCPKERLEPSIEALIMAKDQNEAKEAIAEAGEKIIQFYIDAKKFAPGPVVWLTSEKVTDKLLYYLLKAMEESHKGVNQFKKDPSMKNALAACEADRRSMLLLFLARSGFHDEERIKWFRNDMKRALDCDIILSRTMKDSKDKQIIDEWAESEQYRLDILDSMLDNDMDRACNLMRNAIDKAFKEKYGMRLDE